MTLPFEPFRIKTVEPIQITTIAQRREFLKEAHHNLFRLASEQVMIDLLTDSGTGAMSSRQWAGMMRGDESYAGSSSFHRLVEVVERLTGIQNVLPTHQGRASERLLVEAIIGHPLEVHRDAGLIVPNNAHFDTTRRMIEHTGAQALNLLCTGGDNPRTSAAIAPFKGNMDLRKLEKLLEERGDDVPFVIITITCNSNGGQPVSLENVRAVRAICNRYEKLFFLDACRFVENAWFIKQREPGQAGRSIRDIVREMFDLSDGAALSTKKDGLANTGGLLLIRDDELHRKACNLCVFTEGFQMTYGGLPGRDLEAIAIGLQEVMDEAYLNSRMTSIETLAADLIAGGVAIVEPAGGHAVYLDAEEFCPHLSRPENPAQALACAIYEHGGVRASRIGSVLRNRAGQPMELVRLAIPRRTYTQAHLDYVAQLIVDLKAKADQIAGLPLSQPWMACSEEPEYETVDA